MKTSMNHVLSGLTLIIFILLSFSCATEKKVPENKVPEKYYAGYMVVTEPPGAHISFTADGVYMGLSPTNKWWYYNYTREAKTLQFLIEKPGYKTVTKKLTVYPKYSTKEEALEDSRTLFVLLEPVSSSTFQTTITITSEPSDAAVYGNENYWGTTPLEKNISWSNENSRIELRVEKSGYITNRRVITPTDTRIHIVLQML